MVRCRRSRGSRLCDLNNDLGVTIFDFPIFATNFGVGVAFPVGLSDVAAEIPAAEIQFGLSDTERALLEHPLSEDGDEGLRWSILLTENRRKEFREDLETLLGSGDWDEPLIGE